MNKYIIDKEIILFDYLKEILPNKSKNNIKSLLKNECVSINNEIITKYNYSLKKNDILQIKYKTNNLNIIYEDNNIIVIDKPSGILTISDGKEKVNTMYHYVLEYLKKKKQKVFIIHRLDKDTSGIVMFAKNEKIKKLYQDNWNNLVIKRGYIAVVCGKTKDNDTIKSYLKENSNMMVYSAKDGKLAITHYEKIKSNNKYSMLQIYIDTGRKNQIRVHMKENGTPIIGDKKYGCKDNSLKRLGLHSNILIVKNPINNKILKFSSNYPKEFDELLRR